MAITALEKEDFFSRFGNIPHIFLAEEHLAIHLQRDSKCKYLVDLDSGLGIFLKISSEGAQCPYAAPFGGLFSKDERTDYGSINQFIRDLTIYLLKSGLNSLRLGLPAPIYSTNTTTKLINSLIRGGYKLNLIPEINSHLLLREHNRENYPKNIKEIIRKTSRSKLKIEEVFDDVQKLNAYKIVEENRTSRGRKMSMNYSHLRLLDTICKSRFFIVKNKEGESVASAITFKSAQDIIYAQYWGDNPLGRSLNAMDFIAVSLVDIFQLEGWNIFDLGVSTENGVPNSGLLRFKESHQFISTLKLIVEINLI